MIGAGRLGTSLALALRAQGASLLGFTAHSAAGRAQAQAWLGEPAQPDIAALVALRPHLYIIAVPDQALAEVAAELGAGLVVARTAPERGDTCSAGAANAQAADPASVVDSVPVVDPVPVVAHTSGATSVAILAPCEQAGAVTLVFHPLQTFSEPVTGSTRFPGTAIAITPSDVRPESPASTLGFALAHTLGARPFSLPDDKRGLYHAAATFACNYLVTLEHHSKRLFVQAGLPEDDALSLFLPLVRATLDNVAAQGTVAALTGPLSRGDTQTIFNHLEVLASDAPDLLPLYKALGRATLDLVEARGEVAPDVIAELAGLLDDPTGLLKGSDRPAALPSREPGA